MRAAGTMSGTSLDGTDMAVIVTDGVEVFETAETGYRVYTRPEREALRAALGLWPGAPGVAEAARVVEDATIGICDRLEDIALLGFHGQTLAHDPGGRGTHQAGDGARVAGALGIDTVWDFRSVDVALGGQGAPLAPFYHWACARRAGLTEPVGILNLGGVGNLTWLDPRAAAPELPGACIAFDTGPANAPMDDLMQARGLGDYDRDGALAAAGTADADVVAAFLRSPYFSRIGPKSLDRNGFPALADGVAHLGDADALATLAACAAGAVAVGLTQLATPPRRLFVTGGGRRNAALMAALARATGIAVEPVEALDVAGDLMEAQAFAYLAVRVAGGLPTSAPGTTGVAAAVGGGTISRVG